MKKRELFITLEGVEGVGKSTHMAFIAEKLRAGGHTVTLTREPGGTAAGEAVREILLHGKEMHIAAETELLLIFSARAQHLEEVIRPALSRDELVLCDRFTDATYAYQGGGRGIAKEKIKRLEAWVQEGLKPDITILLDAPVEIGLARANQRSSADRFESETVAFFERVRQSYLAIAKDEPQRVHLIDANKPLEAVQQDIADLLRAKQLC